jgi:hypothetical protein
MEHTHNPKKYTIVEEGVQEVPNLEQLPKLIF